MNNNIIEARELSKTYQRGSEKIHALRNVSLNINRGGFTAIVGPSGSGKTTLLNLLGCLDTPSGGTLSINGEEVSGLPERKLVEIRRRNIGFVFQQFYLLPTLNVRENIALPLMFNHKNHDAAKLESILEIVGLSHRGDHLPHQLSGGEMQRVAIGRALVNNPEIILADEPTGNLDSATANRIIDLFRELCRNGLTLIIVTHNMELADTAGGLIRIRDGEITHVSESMKVPTTARQ
jgi:putative ABC transport system ATP-binding protein